MKKIITAITLLLALPFFICCNKETDGNNQEENGGTIENREVSLNAVSFKKVNLSGARALALAPPKKAATKADGPSGVENLLYILDDSGELKEVEYTIVVEGEDGAGEVITAKLKLAMQYIYCIGTKWLWLYNCSYYFEDLDQVENEAVRSAITKLIEDFGDGHSFLVRRTDGALFSWDDQSNPSMGFPWNSEEKIMMSEVEVRNSVKSVGDDIVTGSLQENGYSKLYCIYDEGNVLTVKKLLNDDVYAYNSIIPIPGEDAFLFIPTHVNDFVVMFTKTVKMKLISKGSAPEGNIFDVGSGIAVAGNKLYRSFPGTNGTYYFDDSWKNEFWLYSELSGESFNLYDGHYCTLTLDREQTLCLRSITNSKATTERQYVLTALDADPMCFTVQRITGSERGITLSPGTYSIYLDEQFKSLYVDDEKNRTHAVGPIHYFYPLQFNAEAQTASWGDLYMTYLGPNPEVYETPYGSPVSWTSISKNRLALSATLDLENRSYTEKIIKFPDGFPINGYINGYAYEMDGKDAYCIYSLETLQKETVPVIWSELPVDIVGEIEWGFDFENLAFCGRARTLEGNYIIVYIPVTGDNRGIASISVTDTSGAGETVTQLIRLN